MVATGAYTALWASRQLGYPLWCQAVFVALGGLVFIVQVRSEWGRCKG